MVRRMVHQVIRRVIAWASGERSSRETGLLEATLHACREGADTLKEARLQITNHAGALGYAGDPRADDYTRVVSKLWRAEGALLEAAEGDLHHQLGLHVYRPLILAPFERQQFFRLPLEHPVG